MARTGNTRGSSLRRLSIGPGLILRQLRSDPAVVVALIVVILVATAALAATPRLFNQMADDGLQHAITAAPAVARNVQVSRNSRIVAARSGPQLTHVARSGETFREERMPPSLQKLVADQQFLVDSPRFTVEALPEEPVWPFPVFMRFRYQEEILDHVRLVEGRFPEPRDPILVPIPPIDDPAADAEGEPAEDLPTEELLPVYELAVTAETLQNLEVGIGGRMILQPDMSDVAFRDVPRSQLGYRLVVEISGLIEPNDPDEDYWFQDLQLHRTRVVENPDYRLIYATGLMTPADYPRLLGDAPGVSFRYEWRYFVDPEGLDAASVADLASDIRGLEISYPPTAVFQLGRDTVSTGLNKVISGYFDQRNSTVAILALVSLGLFVVTLAIITQLAALVAAMQLQSLYLLRSRGASPSQLVLSRLAHGLVISIPAAAIGFGVAQSLVTARSSALSARVAVAVALGAAGLIVTAALPAIRSELGTMISAGERRQPSLRRKVAEGLVVIFAATAALLLRRRGLAVDAQSPDGTAFDPLLAAAPTLLALAVAIVTLRLYVYPIRFLAWLAGKRRDIVGFVGLRRILQQSAAARLPLLVVVLAAAVALFAWTVQESIEAGQERSSWYAVGADFRVSGAGDTTPLVRDLDLSDLDSIERSASGTLVNTFDRSGAVGSVRVEFLAIAAADYAAVVSGTGADPGLPASLVEPSISDVVGTADDPIPAMVQRTWMEERNLGVGDSFDLDIGPRILSFSIAAAREAFPSLTVGTPFVVADVGAVRAAGGGELLPSLIYLRAAEAARSEIQQTLAERAPAALLSARRTQLESVRTAPFVSGVLDGFGFSYWMATFFGVIAVVAAFLVTARARARDHGYLRALGLSPRQATAATIVEQAPPVVVAALAGCALGIGIAVLFAPGIDLAAFTGSDLEVALRLDVNGVLIVLAALMAATWLAVAASSRLAGRVNLGEVLRLGER
jgi:putative ABC transport system permease protein